MRTDTPVQIRLQDYRPSDFLIDRVDLDVRLAPHDTRITARLASACPRRIPGRGRPSGPPSGRAGTNRGR
ncbi:MAG: hypothetical protein EOO66_16220 [Methylobacterium sp.]|nr:MAG: hypothetical protein EOO66_16220 [Methylobacterium sp.]